MCSLLLGLFSGCTAKPLAVSQASSVPLPRVPVLASVLEPLSPSPQTKPRLHYRLKMLTFRAQAINDSGLVCGALTVSKRDPHSHQQYYEGGHLAVLEHGLIRDLGKMPHTDWCIAKAVNNRGEITGVMGEAALPGGGGNPDTIHMFLWSRGHLHDLRVGGDALAINDKGQIVGQKEWSHGKYGYQHGFLYRNGRMHEITNPFSTGFSQINAINNNGQMVGFAGGPNTTLYGPPDGASHALLYDDGIPKEISLSQRSGARIQSIPVSLNDVGQIVFNAASNDKGVYGRCLLWQKGNVADLGMLPGFNSMVGVAVNKRGEVAGTAEAVVPPGSTAGRFTSHPFLWQHGSLYDLNDLVAHPGWTLTAANGLNNRGQIVGQGEGGGKEYNFLLTPVAN